RLWRVPVREQLSQHRDDGAHHWSPTHARARPATLTRITTQVNICSTARSHLLFRRKLSPPNDPPADPECRRGHPVLHAPLKEPDAVPGMPEHAAIAGPAEQTTDLAGSVVVVDRQFLMGTAGPATQGALAALCVVELPVLLVRNAEGPLDVLAMPGSPALPLDPKVVGLAAGARELGVSSLLAGQLIAELGHAVLAHLSASHHTSFLNGC